jgi:hypothetical protein
MNDRFRISSLLAGRLAEHKIALPTPSFVPFTSGKARHQENGAHCIAGPRSKCWEIEFHANLLYSHQVKEFEKWKSKEVVHNRLAKDRPIGLPARYALTHRLREAIPRVLPAQSSRSSPALAQLGTPTRWARPSSSQPVAAGRSAQEDRSKKSGRVTWSGSPRARSIGMVLRRPRP